MTSLWPQLEPLLPKVARPARYIGCEDGMQVPTHAPHKVAWLAYPDTYEIGLPNQGLQILYEILNERPDAVAERTYAPWGDLEALLRERSLPLFSVDTHRPAPEFDILAFNLSAELVYVPSLYDVAYDGARLASVTPCYPDIPERVEKRPIADLGAWPYPKSQLVPLTEVVHDRLNVTPSPSASPPRSNGPGARASPSPPRRAPGASARSSTSSSGSRTSTRPWARRTPRAGGG